MTLDNIKPNMIVRIINIKGSGLLRKRLLEMGLTPNTQVKIKKIAPLGDPIEVFLRHYILTLRKRDAAQIEVMEDKNNGNQNQRDEAAGQAEGGLSFVPL